MKKILIMVIGLLLIISGCSTHQGSIISSKTDIEAEMTPVNNESQSELPIPPSPSPSISPITDTNAETTPVINEPQSAPPISPSPSPAKEHNKGFVFSLDDKEIVFYFDMTMDEALKILDDAGIEHETMDDSSPFRSWSGHYVSTNKSFSFVFDLRNKLHEIRLSSTYNIKLPISVWDSYKDMIATLGDVGYKKHPASWSYGTHYCEYQMDGYYLRPTFGDEDLPVEDSSISKIILSKYSIDQYKDNIDAATLIFTNKAGERAEFCIGMSVNEVKAKLEEMDLYYRISNDVISGSCYFSCESDPEDFNPYGYDFYFYFDRNHCVYTIETYGPGILTQLGLQDGDSEEKMLRLYGEGYINLVTYNGYWNNFSYISGDNYLNISTSSERDQSAPVTVLEITRYIDKK